jgi:sialic acid synthase SpsE
LHLNRDIKKGEKLSSEFLIALRPGDGINPMEMDLVIGKIANKDIYAGQKISFLDLL